MRNYLGGDSNSTLVIAKKFIIDTEEDGELLKINDSIDLYKACLVLDLQL